MIPAIIMAKGQSKRIPHKNLQKICGISLVEWFMIQCANSHLLGDVILATEDAKIAEIGEKYGAIIYDRPGWTYEEPEVSGTIVMKWILDEYKKRTGLDTEHFFSAFCTSPLRRPQDIDNAIIEAARRPEHPKHASVFFPTVTEIVDHTGLTVLFDKHHGYGHPVNHVCVFRRSEVMRMMKLIPGEDNARLDSILETDLERMQEYVTKTHPLACQWWQVHDVDEPKDLEHVELFLNHFILKGRGKKVYEEYGKDAERGEQLRESLAEIERGTGISISD